MSQPRLFVPTSVVRGLLAECLAARCGQPVYPEQFVEALAAVPEVRDGWMDFHAVSRVVNDSRYVSPKPLPTQYKCQNWMRDRLNKAKVKDLGTVPGDTKP